MKKILVIATILASVSAFAAGPKVPYTHEGFYSTEKTQKAVHFVSVDDIKESLKGQGPINVSFDIDDTLLHSSGYFRYGVDYFQIPGDSRGKISYLYNQKFWDYVAEMGDEHSIPKQSAADLIKMHLERGDKVIFITGRTASKDYSADKLDSTAKVLQKEFGIVNMQPISYRTPETKAANKYDKTYYIKKYGVSLHYGDSDDDILAAREAGIRGIRVERATTSTNTSGALNGGFGEEVVKNSSY